MLEIPPVKDTDAEDVVWGLQTADTLWKRGERIDALVWLRRAAQAAGDANDDDRALELARYAAELTEWMANNDDSSEARPAAEEGEAAAAVEGEAELDVEAEEVEEIIEEADEEVSASPASPWAEVAAPVPPRPPPPPPAAASRPQAPEAPPPAEPSEGQSDEDRPSRASVPPAEKVHAGMFDPWADQAAQGAAAPKPTATVAASSTDDDEEVVTSVRPQALAQRPEIVAVPPPPPPPPPQRASRPQFPAVSPPKPPPLPPRPRPPVPKAPEASTRETEKGTVPPAEVATIRPPVDVAANVADDAIEEEVSSVEVLEASSEAEPAVPAEAASDADVEVAEAPVEAEAAAPAEATSDADVEVAEGSADAAVPAETVSDVSVEGAAASGEAEAEAPAGAQSDADVAVPDIEAYVPPPEELRSVAPPEAAPAAPAATQTLNLDDVEAFADLPDDVRTEFAAAATVHALSEGEEISAFALAYVVSGKFDVAATVVDAPAVRLGEGAVLRSRGTTDENVPMRLICAEGSGTVATWSDAAVTEAFRTTPWVEDDLRAAADKVQTLVGITIGPLGERLDVSIREEIVSRLEMRPLGPNEIVVKAGEPVPGLLLVGIGELELVKDDVVTGVVSSGDFLFPTEVLGAGSAPATARAGKGGAVVMFGDRRIAQELLVTCPPLLEVFAGM